MDNLENKESFPWLSSASAVAVVGVGIACLSAYQNNQNFSLFFVWYASLVAALIIPVARYVQCRRLLGQIKKRVEQKLGRRRTQIIKSLRRKVRPRVDFCETLDSVCRMARELISTAHGDRIDEHRYITFYGAAHLSVPESESEEYGAVGGSGEVSPYQQYLGALEAVTGDKVRMRRYIKLFTREEFETRSSVVQREYVNWLKGQYNMLSRNPNYILGDIVRAPRWGSNVARIITHSAMMEITGTGEAAMVITDNHLCETIRQSARETILGNEQTKNHAENYGQAKGCNKTVADFKNYFSEMERAVSARSTGDEEGRY